MADYEPDEELAELLKAISDGTLSPKQHFRLESLLQSDPEARAIYLRYVNVDALLSWRYAPVPEPPTAFENSVDAVESDEAGEGLEAFHPSGEMVSLRMPHETSRRKSNWLNAVVICASLLGIVAGVPLGWILNQQTPDAETVVMSRREFVATLVSVSEDTVWSDGHGSPRLPGEGLDKGWMRLEAGVVEMRFQSGAIVTLEGPTTFGVDSPLRGFLDHGTIGVYAPEEARDFVIGTASMEVVDLGTRFNMTIDQNSGEAEVEVIEGLVDLYLDGEGTSNRIQSLPAGRSAVVNAKGEVVRIEGEALDPQPQDTSALLAHWKLDDVSDDGHVADASGNELHGTLNGNTRAISRDGKVGRALDLGRQGCIDLSEHIPMLTDTAAFTLTAWVRDAGGIVFSVSDGTPHDRIQFELHGQRLLYGWQKGDRFDLIPARVSEWERGRWYHIAVSVSGGTVSLYRDGHSLITPRSHGTNLNTSARAPIDVDRPTHAYLGFLVANHNRKNQFLGGEIDDVQFYGRALDEQAIRYLVEHPGETFSESVTP